MNEFTSAPVAVIASASASDIDRNSSVTVTFSTDPFGQSSPETIIVSGIHPTLGLVLHYDVDRHRCQLIKMDIGAPSHRLPQWKSRLRSAYILSINTMSVHTIADIGLVISEAHAAGRPSIVVVFTKDDAPNFLSAVGLQKLYFDQLRIMRGHIDNTVLAVVHKAITGPKFNRRTLQKQLDWNDWLAAEWIQLDNYDKQSMFGAPCTAPVDAPVFYWVWLYFIKPHENNHKKVRGVCDGSTCGGKIMTNGATYAPTPQKIDFCLQIALSATLGMYIWHADAMHAFNKAERSEQMYCMHCDQGFHDWWAEHYPTTPLPPDAVVPVLKNLQGHPEGPRLWSVRSHGVLIALEFKNTTHAPCLYYGTFNAEFVIFLQMVDDFSIGCKLEETYTKMYDILDKNWQVHMSRYGMTKHFNDIDVYQSRTHISISSKIYLDTVVKIMAGRILLPPRFP
jgi:hypothetical protein